MRQYNTLSIVIAAFNDEDVIKDALESASWANEIIVVIAKESSDSTLKIAKSYTDKIFFSKNHLGIQRKLGISNAHGEWILVLDTDERVSQALQHEIKEALQGSKFNGYYAPFGNYFLGHKVKWGNQDYEKRRLFRKDKGKIENLKIHPEIIIEEPVSHLKGKILHYSFRSISQTLKKFTYYAWVEAPLLFAKSERIHLKKLTLYPLHMFWSIFVEDQGWRDGIWGLGLDLCFTYYEFARYWFLFIYGQKHSQVVRN